MATDKTKAEKEYTVEEKLKTLYDLQTILSEIDRIKTLRGEGENIAIGFKSPFVLEILSNIESENVVLELSDPTRPGLFLPFENEDNDEDLLMLLMPMMV